jgi:hypothetical protein
MGFLGFDSMSQDIEGYMGEMERFGAPTPLMTEYGISWPTIVDQAQHCINLLESQGDTILSLVTGTLRMIAALSRRDMIEIFALLNATYTDVAKLIAAIKAEFGIE